MISKELLLPRDKYEDAKLAWGKSPYAYEIEKDGKYLFYFGANHSNDPKNHQYPVLREFWKRFLDNSKEGERVTLVEASLRILRDSEAEAILSSSEGGWVTWAANKKGIPVACPDISKEDFMRDHPEWDIETMFLLSFLHWVDGLSRYPEPKPTIREEFGEWMKYKERRNIFANLDGSFENMKLLYKEKIGKEFNENENQNYLVDSNKTGTVVNELARAYSDARELKIVSEIVRYWNEGKSVFIAFGSGHLIIQRPALEKLLT